MSSLTGSSGPSSQSSNMSITDTPNTCIPSLKVKNISHNNEHSFHHGDTVLCPGSMSLCENLRLRHNDEPFTHSDAVLATIGTNNSTLKNVCLYMYAYVNV